MKAISILEAKIEEIDRRFSAGTISSEDIQWVISTCRSLLICAAKGEDTDNTEDMSALNKAPLDAAVYADSVLEVYADGACEGNPGPGGWGAIVKNGKHTRELSGGSTNTTNNRMELIGVIEALKTLPGHSRVVVTTDSQYVQKGITGWISNWKRNGWRTADKKPVKNKDLWVELDSMNQKHKIEWRWVKGHAGHPENERCDELARKAIAGFKRF